MPDIKQIQGISMGRVHVTNDNIAEIPLRQSMPNTDYAIMAQAWEANGDKVQEIIVVEKEQDLVVIEAPAGFDDAIVGVICF